MSEFVVQGNVGGYYDSDGHFIVCEEYGCSDKDTDRYIVEVLNGDGYYSEDGSFHRFSFPNEY